MEQDEDELALASPDEPPQKRVKLSPDPLAIAPAPSTSAAPPASAAPATPAPTSRPDLWLAATASLARFGRGPYSTQQLGECVNELCEQGYPSSEVVNELWRVHTTARASDSTAPSTSAVPVSARPQPSPSASTSSMPSTPAAHTHYALWTTHDNQRLVEMKRQGLSMRDIAERLGRTAAAVQGQYNKLRARDPTLPRSKRGRPSSTAPSASPARSTPVAASPSAPPTVKPDPHLLDGNSPLAASTSRLATVAAAAPARTPSSSTPDVAPAPAAPPPRTRPLRRRIGLAFTGPAYERALAALQRLREPVDLELDLNDDADAESLSGERIEDVQRSSMA
ncbi:hypothetical protein JCM9279_004008 [Rhodotorula babjevae]